MTSEFLFEIKFQVAFIKVFSLIRKSKLKKRKTFTKNINVQIFVKIFMHKESNLKQSLFLYHI